MSQALSLESFEEALAETSGPDISFEEGYAAGLAAAEAAASAQAAALNETFVQALSDIEFTYAEARGQILQSLTPLFSVITAKILPHCVETGFAGQLTQALLDAASADANRPIHVHVHPDQLEAAALSAQGLSSQITVTADPALGPHSAWISHDTHETMLDADALLAQINTALGALQDLDERNPANG